MIQLVERLNTEYDVQNISTREAAEQALDKLTVSGLISPLLPDRFRPLKPITDVIMHCGQLDSVIKVEGSQGSVVSLALSSLSS